MTVTLVSGKTEEFDNVWVKFPVMDLSEEHRKIVIEKIKKEANIADDWRIPSNYYCAGGRRWIPGDAEDNLLTVKNGKSFLTHKKPEDCTLIIHREEAERILKTYNRSVVWVDADENENRRYWIAYETPEDNSYDYHKWSRLDAQSISEPEDYEVDKQTQGLVHDFYMHGGKGGLLDYYCKRMKNIAIPQFAEFCQRKAESEFKDFFNEAHGNPEYIRQIYIELVRSVVHEFDHLEESWNAMNVSQTETWRIVHIPAKDQTLIKDSSYYSKAPLKNPTYEWILTGANLKEWLHSNFISQNKAAELCSVTSRTFQRWIAGKPPIPKGMWELLYSKIQ